MCLQVRRGFLPRKKQKRSTTGRSVSAALALSLSRGAEKDEARGLQQAVRSAQGQQESTFGTGTLESLATGNHRAHTLVRMHSLQNTKKKQEERNVKSRRGAHKMIRIPIPFHEPINRESLDDALKGILGSGTWGKK